MATIVKYQGKRGISWNARVRKNGTDHTATFATRRMAEDWCRKIEHEIVQETYSLYPEKPVSHTIGELIDLYCERILPQKAPGTQRKQRKILDWWKGNLGDTYVQNVTTALLEDYKATLLRKPFTNGTTNFYLNTLSPVFHWAASPRLNWITSNPFLHVRRLPEKGRMPMVTDQQIQDLLDWCQRSKSPYLYLFVRLCLGTGGRHMEILHLKWSQVNLKRKTIMFLNTKGKQDRIVPLDSMTLDLLQQRYDMTFTDENWHYKLPDSTYVFESTRKPGKVLRAVAGGFQIARRRAGLPWLRPHDLRHVFASRIAEAGGDIATIADLLGHKNIKTTIMRYRHLTEKHSAGIVEKMAQGMFQKKA